MAYSPTLTWKKCIMCGHTTPLEDSETQDLYAKPTL